MSREQAMIAEPIGVGRGRAVSALPAQ
jgi:hypothetical protein